jgi:acyl-CoA synthetase (AMP-forming)/AMP-acid ligase II
VRVDALLARVAAVHGARPALEGPQGTVTFAELADRVFRLAAGLRRLGLQPGDRVLDLQPNQNTYVETELACCAAGVVRVALNHRLHDSDWARIADDCGARALVYDARYAQRTEALRAGLDPVVVIGDGPGTPYHSLLDGPRYADGSGDPDALVSLNYTSGSTGRPKGVRRTHRVRDASRRAMLAAVLGPVAPSDVYLHAGPITHTSGLFTLPFLDAGAKQLILPAFEAGAVVEAVRERGATHTALVPTMVARLLALDGATDGAEGELKGLKMLGYAGAPMPPGQIRQAYERLTPNLVQYYGLVEAIPPVTVLTAADHAAGLDGTRPDLLTAAGRAAGDVELSIVDEDGRLLPSGEVGEVVTRGPHVMPGYWAGEAGTKALRAGWLHTGDLGRMSDDGVLWLVDRKGDMIITGGYNVYPREVEDAIAAVPGVREVAVVGLPDDEWGQRIVALYTGAATPDTVDTHCRAMLASYKKPKEIRRVDAFPLNATGKIAKNRLRETLRETPPDTRDTP